AGAFYTPDWDAEVFPMPAVAGSENDAFSLSYTIAAATPENQLFVISADPADGSTVESLKRINLQLGNTTDFGVEWKSGLQAPVTDAEGNQVTSVRGQDFGSVFVLSLADEITAPGTYTVSVPAGAFYTPDWDAEVFPMPAVAGSENDAFTLTYTIDGSTVGVDGLSTDEICITVNGKQVIAVGLDNPDVCVYSISGVEVARGNGSVNVDMPGIYVVKAADADKTIVKRVCIK
ncbi:MAG: hypothetical protein K2N25_07350, partial [Muribaculaceae bacterium]|nr:hypothetical protein [Muribaculaceae bacterium]